jgi:tellurite resistance-related uncharacterized protein
MSGTEPERSAGTCHLTRMTERLAGHAGDITPSPPPHPPEVDMAEPHHIPDGHVLARTTDVFDNDTVPAGLLRAHRVADGIWGRLVVHAGTVRFVFEDAADDPATVSAGESVVIPPARLHHVELDGPARFAVEFHRPVAGNADPDGRAESSGLA